MGICIDFFIISTFERNIIVAKHSQPLQFLFLCLFIVVLSSFFRIFTHIETSLLQLKGFKPRPVPCASNFEHLGFFSMLHLRWNGPSTNLSYTTVIANVNHWIMNYMSFFFNSIIIIQLKSNFQYFNTCLHTVHGFNSKFYL